MVSFIFVMLVLMRVFTLAGRMGSQAKVLTCAVHLAENAAEAVAASDSEEALFTFLDEDGIGHVFAQETEKGILFRAQYDEKMQPAPEGSFWVDVSWEPQGGGELVESGITVYWNGDEIYALDTAVYIGQ